MKFDVSYNLQDIYLFQKLHHETSAYKWFFRIMAILLGLMAFSLAYTFFYALLIDNVIELFSLSWFIFYLIFTLFFFSISFRAKISAYLSIKQREKYLKPFILNLTAKEIKITTKDSKTSSKWSALINYEIDDNLVALYQAPKVALLIPKRLANDKQWQELITLVKKQAKKQTVKNKTTTLILLFVTFFLGFTIIMNFFSSLSAVF